MLCWVPGHCDPTVNLYDFMIGVRAGARRGGVIIRVDARGALSKARLLDGGAAHKTQRSGPGQAHRRRQYKRYDKAGQRRQVAGSRS